MTVLSKLLYGDLQVSAFDWLQPALQSGQCRGAVCVRDAELLKGPALLSLFPSGGGNIHSFTAASSCAVLDVLAPPYDTDVRECSYYEQEGEYFEHAGQRCAWLRGTTTSFSCLPYKPPSR